MNDETISNAIQKRANDIEIVEALQSVALAVERTLDPKKLASFYIQGKQAEQYVQSAKLGFQIAQKAAKIHVVSSLKIAYDYPEHLYRLGSRGHEITARSIARQYSLQRSIKAVSDWNGSTTISLSGLLRLLKAEDRERAWEKKKEEARQNNEPDPSAYRAAKYNPYEVSEEIDRSYWKKAATYPFNAADVLQQLIDNAAITAESFTVQEIADDLLARAEISIPDPDENEWGRNPLEQFTTGAREMVRSALRQQAAGGISVMRTVTIYGKHHNIPRFVTYECADNPHDDSDKEWRRIPWGSARLSHLYGMAAYRREQARQMAVAADSLEALYEDLSGVTANQPPKEDYLLPTTQEEVTAIVRRGSTPQERATIERMEDERRGGER